MKCLSKYKNIPSEGDGEYDADYANDSRERNTSKGYSSIYNQVWYEGDENKNRIMGHSLSSFINLPSNSRVYINYKGEDHAEGFLSLRKV